MSYLVTFATWLSKSGLTALVTRAAWLVPALQVVHILAIAALVIVAVLINLRVLGLVERQYPLREVVSRYIPIIWIALGILAFTGALLIASEPYRALFRTAFWVKMVLIVMAVSATSASRASFAGLAHFGKREWPVGGWVRRILAVTALLAWAGVIFFGRWIAYADAWPGAPG
jgi:hypothetical protein